MEIVVQGRNVTVNPALDADSRRKLGKLERLESIVPEISALEPDIERLSDEALRAQTADFRQRSERGEDLDEMLAEAFATVREAGKRVLGQRHFDVQLMGGAALHFGWVA